MASNNFLPWGDSAGNIMSNADYESNIQRTDGVELGLADPALHNRLYRQVSLMAAAIGQIIADSGLDANDGNMAELVSALKKVFARWGGGTFTGGIILNEKTTFKKRTLVDKGDGVSATTSTGNDPKMATLYLSVDGNWTNALSLYEDRSEFTKPLALNSGGFGRKFSSEDDLKNYLKQLLGI